MVKRPFQFDPDQVEVEIVEEAPEQVPAPLGAERIEPGASERRGKKIRAWLTATAALAITGVFAFETINYLRETIASSPLIGMPLAALTAVAVASAGALLWREFRDLTSLRRQEGLRAEAERLAQSELHDDAPELLAKIEDGLKDAPGARRGLDRYHASSQDTLNDGELIRLFEKTALAPVDQRAYRIVLESSRDVAILSAMSPTALMDSAFVLTRSLAMLRAIARLYGVRPGYAATLTLLRRGLRNAILAGLADMVAHAATEHVGAGILAMLSARAGQGAGNALLCAKLGLEAIKLTRPMPFIEEEPPKLGHVREAIFEGEPETAPRPKGATV